MRIVLAMFLFIPLLGYNQVTLDWQRDTGAVSIAADDFDNVYTVRWDYNPAGDIYLKKINSTGTVQWEVSFDNTDNTRHEVATWVEVDNDNNIIVTGTIRSGYSSPVNAASVVMKFNPSGSLLWRVVYETSFDGSYTKKCLVDAENNIYILGMGSGSAGYVTKVKKLDTDGNPVWSFFDAAGIGAPLNFKFTKDNNILIIGRGITGSINGYAKIDLDGNLIWDYAGVYSLTIGDAAGDAIGNTYIINGDYFGTSGGSILTKLSLTGSVIWDEVNSITGTKVEVGSDNNPVLGGFPSTGSFGVAMMKYNSDGDILWENTDADGPGYSLLLHAMMKLDNENNAYFAAGTLFEMAVAKTNADGSFAWIAACSGGYANAFVFGSDYSIFVVGGTTAHFVQDTPPVCEAPSGLFANNITATKARINWALEPGAFQYEIWYKKSTAATWKKKFAVSTSSKLNLKNLTCNTNYNWQIRTICDTTEADLISAFSAIQNFTTAACREAELLPQGDSAITIFPNPAINQFYVNLNGNTISKIRVIDFTGKVVMSINEIPDAIISIPVNELPAGVYLINFTTSENIISKELFITK